MDEEVKPGRKKTKTAGEQTENEVGGAPKSFMVPYVLLMLRDSLMHGYAIWERLMSMGFPGLDENDRANLYRTLRQLEKEGKVQSQWDTTAEGPARRVYSLTDNGEAFLKLWATGLDQYRRSLDFFFNMYTNPFGLSWNANAPRENGSGEPKPENGKPKTNSKNNNEQGENDNG